ncbi:3-demethylubiquinone-9 3-methyltransferase [Croceibacterium mercuriale]|uniref:3-demethylubiquinone-9 3-methyltransferase n=1 Tax=Croceibacterium mercuriale TaxID=1572751 RepID=A0A0B2C2J0_9SPHN|nr:VOC family protein [Croceibacterium mercuriale]KHL26206.1 3-demethylubiquinone-9 3-methyltransferase [Croceibacterium mercuriale]
MNKAEICLWFRNNDAADAARFYAETFPDSHVGHTQYAATDYPGGKQGDPLVVHFTVMGLPCFGLNGGQEDFYHNLSFSFSVTTEDQAETDRYWNALIADGGQASQCGWCTDRWGISWQITPRVLTEGMADPDPAVARRVMEAMMTMGKIDVAAIEAARRGG